MLWVGSITGCLQFLPTICIEALNHSQPRSVSVLFLRSARSPLAMSEAIGPGDSASQVGAPASDAASRGGILVAVPRSDVSERKRMYGMMDYHAQTLSPAALAVYAATKGQHNKRQKMMELFLSQGRDMGMAMNLYISTESIDQQANSAKWEPLTAKQMKDHLRQLVVCLQHPSVICIAGSPSPSVPNMHPHLIAIHVPRTGLVRRRARLCAQSWRRARTTR